MTRWKDGKLDLGALGVLDVSDGYSAGWFWELSSRDGRKMLIQGKTAYATQSAARRAAVSWLRRALQQAGKRVEVK
jgi:hypothetical protein